MKSLNVFYDIDDTLVETLDLFFFVDNLMALSYLRKVNHSDKKIDFERILSDLMTYSKLNNTISESIKHLPKDIREELNSFKEHIRKADDQVMEVWPKKGMNPFSSQGLESALDEIVNEYNLNLNRRDIENASKIPFHFELRRKYPLYSIKELIKESLEFDVNIFILSKGNFLSQAKKIEHLGLKDIIPLKNLYILHEKNANTLKEIILYQKLNNALIIGNSLKEEIFPALELEPLGVKSLWVKHNDYFSQDIQITDKKVEIFKPKSFNRYIAQQLYD